MISLTALLNSRWDRSKQVVVDNLSLILNFDLSNLPITQFATDTTDHGRNVTQTRTRGHPIIRHAIFPLRRGFVVADHTAVELVYYHSGSSYLDMTGLKCLTPSSALGGATAAHQNLGDFGTGFAE